MTKVFTIIVTYNGAGWIETCMKQLLQSTMPTNIIVIDNCSTDNSISILNKFEGQFSLIASDKNLGFGAGNNIGIQHAIENNASFIFLLNQDAYVEKDCIEKTVKAMQANPEYGIISPLQLNPSGKELDTSFKKYLSRSIGENAIPSLLAGRPDKIYPVRFVNAASWMMPVAAVKKTGLFHPAFYHYGEDNHYCSRMQYHQYKTGIYCGAALIHDREYANPAKEKQLLRQLKTIPLYTLLDIRKNFLLARVLGYRKLARIYKKLTPYLNDEINKAYSQQLLWFKKNIDLAKKIRKETKQDAGL